GSGDCVRYCDVAEGEFGSCAVRMLVPALEEETNEPCVEICLDDLDGNPHCGLSIEVASQDWSGACPATKGQDITVTQTCWGVTANECVWEDFDEETTVVDLDASDFESDKRKVAVLSQWLTLIDTIGPIFDFCYPTGTDNDGLVEGCFPDEYCGDLVWDHESIVEGIRVGGQTYSAYSWERCNATVYTTGSHDCAADVYVPSVTLKDECSGV
ncbi:hypothetical protein, partial [Membranihabitans maritimus]|uniref:hypothetical protein n=1 Tax=Membranihabitans maritimus TaxID=2904244 RepID=UPI001F3DCA93